MISKILGIGASLALVKEKVVSFSSQPERQGTLLNPKMKKGLFNDVALVWKAFYQPREGDLVALKHPWKDETVLRVVRAEEHKAVTPLVGDVTIFVPRGHIWVETVEGSGEDSNDFGPVEF